MSKVSLERVLYYFGEISKIPRCTRDEKRISEYLINFAKEHGYDYYTDEYYNVIITREAAPSMADKPKYILQGHSDMVCEKTSESNHDFTKDPIEIIIDGDIMTANETTLGGDNGIAVAMTLAILENKELELPQIEFLCTSQEEEGMVGAHNLKEGILKGSKMINIDSEMWGHVVTACAGGNCINFEFDFESYEEVSDASLNYYEISIDKFFGGHSGIEIHQPRVNAIVETFKFLSKYDDARISKVVAPGKFNAISRTLNVKFATKANIENDFEQFVKDCLKIEPDGIMELKKLDDNLKLVDATVSKNMISLISQIPNGVYEFSKHMEGMVETSMNAGLVEMNNEKLVLFTSTRSNVNSKREEITEICENLAVKYNAKADVTGGYPAWEYDENNELMYKVVEVYEKMYGEKPVLEAIHAGLECAILKQKFPTVEMISIGPDLRDVHTPAEILYISTVEKATDLVVEILLS